MPNGNAKKGERIYYQDQRGALYGIAVCIRAAIHGADDGLWVYHPIKPEFPIEPLHD